MVIYQPMLAACWHADRRQGRALMVKLINSISNGVPKSLTEIPTPGRTLKNRAVDVLAYLDRIGTSNGPTETIDGRLEHLRGSALGFPKPHQIRRQITARNRRIQTPTTPPTMKSL